MNNLAGIDLNLLVALDALLAERNVTRAAQRLGLSQPALSNALNRLRDLLGDPVLVRTGRGMEPTARALSLAAPVRQILEDVARALTPAQSFDPKTSSQRFHIQSAEDVELTILPKVAARFAELAPRAELVLSRVTENVEEELRTGRVDLYLGTWFKLPERLHSHLLVQESHACIARKGHPRVRHRLSLRAFTELGHVVVSPGARPRGGSETIHAQEGLGRRVAVFTSQYLAAARIVAGSDLIAMIPRSIANDLAELLPLAVVSPPLEVSTYPVYAVWHPRAHAQASHRWLRELVVEAMAPGDW